MGVLKYDSDCLNFKSLGICSHCVTVAQSKDLLTEFLEHFQKFKIKPNFTAVSLHGVPTGCSKKGKEAEDYYEVWIILRAWTHPLAVYSWKCFSNLWILNCIGFSAMTVVFIWKFLLHSYSMASFLLWLRVSAFSPYSCMPIVRVSINIALLKQFLPPMAEDNSPFNISGNISKCAGCGNKYVNCQSYSTGSGGPSQ